MGDLFREVSNLRKWFRGISRGRGLYQRVFRVRVSRGRGLYQRVLRVRVSREIGRAHV